MNTEENHDPTVVPGGAGRRARPDAGRVRLVDHSHTRRLVLGFLPAKRGPRVGSARPPAKERNGEKTFVRGFARGGGGRRAPPAAARVRLAALPPPRRARPALVR